MLLSPKAKGDAIPSLIVETDNVKASHGGTVGELDEDQIFYMMTRGIPRAEAVRMLVEGYFEEVVQRLDDPGLEELVRARGSPRSSRAPRTRCASSSGSARRRPDGQRRHQPLADVRADFPVLDREINGHPLVYLDSAATSQKPRQVIEAMDALLLALLRARSTAASTSSAARPTELFEGARERIAAFVELGPDLTTIFTRNATEAINLVAYAWGRAQPRPRRRGAHHRDGAPLEHRALAAGSARTPARGCATCRSPDDGELSLDELDAVLAERHA